VYGNDIGPSLAGAPTDGGAGEPSPEQAEFDRLVDADERIEPRDWMPEG